MLPNKNQLAKIKSTLHKVFSKYKSKGIVSIYLWGSITGDEYNPKTSDIDSIAIVSNDADDSDVLKIRAFLKKQAPEIKDFKINYVYLSELNGGKAKSKLGGWIHPSLLLLDFPYWKWVAGHHFERKDFTPKDITFDQATKLQKRLIIRMHLPKVKQGNLSGIEYFCKYLMKVCHYQNQKVCGKHEFSYKCLNKNKINANKKVIEILLRLKKCRWSHQEAKKALPVLLDFLKKV